MPKIVDHEERRGELAEALWRVIATAGLGGASVRAVAAEAGWSPGAVRYYFSTQDELLRFGIDLQLQRIPERIQEHLTGPPGVARALLLVEEILPLDETRMGETRVWHAALVDPRPDAALAEIRRQGLIGERAVCRIAVADVLGLLPDDPWQALPDDAEREVEKLHAAVDGLAVNACIHPDLVPPDRVRELLREIVADLAARHGRSPE